jgi:hypothetical protein
MRGRWILAGLAFAAFSLGCASTGPGPTYSSTASIRINPVAPPSEGRRTAIDSAEREARAQLLTEAYNLRMNDGRTLDDLAIVDPFVRAVIEDTVRRAKISDRTISEEGVVTLTLSMDLAPLHKLILEYNAHPI